LETWCATINTSWEMNLQLISLPDQSFGEESETTRDWRMYVLDTYRMRDLYEINSRVSLTFC